MMVSRIVGSVLCFLVLSLAGKSQLNYQWDTFHEGNSNLPSAQVTRLEKGKGDTLWIGTSNGVAYLSDSIIQPIAQSAGWFVSAMAYDLQGRLWVGTAGNGAFRRNLDGSFTEFSSATFGGIGGLNHDHILSFAFETNTLWIGTSGGGLYGFDGQNWLQFSNQTTNGLLPFSDIPDLVLDEHNDLWIATSSAGLYAFKDNGNTFFFNTDSGLTHLHVQCLALDANDWMWLGFAGQTNDNHLMRYNRQTSQYQVFGITNTGLPHRNIHDIQQDSLGRFWFASNGGGYGLAYRDSLGFTSEAAFENQLISNNVYALAPGDSQYIFVGHYKGLSTNRDQPGVGFGENSSEAAGLIFPNPSNDLVWLNLPKSETIPWRLVNLSGQLLKEGKGFPLHVSDLRPGQYLIQISPIGGNPIWLRCIRSW